MEENFIHEIPLSTSNIQDDDNKFLKKTMNSINEVVKENFIHETSLTITNIQDDDNIADPSENDLVVNPHIDEATIFCRTCLCSS